MVVLTTLSIIIATACGVLAFRLFRDERRRAEARVVALSYAMDATAHDAEWRLPAADDYASEGPLFSAHRPQVDQGRLVISLGAAFVMAAIAGIVIAIAGSSGGGTSTAPPDGIAASLDLLSMRHTREGTTLAVTGLVRNTGAATTERISAVVYAFDRTGEFVASGQAPLQFSRLSPGEEAPFQVRIPDVADVGRFRVSFRTDAGVVRHVDRRAEQQARLPPSPE